MKSREIPKIKLPKIKRPKKVKKGEEKEKVKKF